MVTLSVSLVAAFLVTGTRYTKYRFSVSIIDEKPVLMSEYCLPPVTCDLKNILHVCVCTCVYVRVYCCNA